MNPDKKIPVKQYCSATPSYPLHGYMAFISMSNSDYSMYYPLDVIQNDIESTCLQIESLTHELHNDIEIEATAIFVPMQLRRLYPLRPQFWEKPKIHYDAADRVKLFQHALKFHSWYQLVATPTTQNDTTQYSIALPTKISTGDRAIEQFMLLTDFPVDETASCAGIYIMEQPFTINWKTKKITSEPVSIDEETLH